MLVYIKKQEVLSSLAGRIEEAKGHLKDSCLHSRGMEEKEEQARLAIVNKKYIEMLKTQVLPFTIIKREKRKRC